MPAIAPVDALLRQSSSGISASPRPGLVRPRACADAAAGLAQQGVHRRDGRHLPAIAGSHVRFPGNSAPGADVPAGPGEAPGRGPFATRPDPDPEEPVVTGGNPGEAGNHPTGGNIGAPGGAEVVSAGADGTAGADEATGAGGTIVGHGDAAGVPGAASPAGAVSPAGLAGAARTSAGAGPPGLGGRHVVVIGGGLAGITAAIRLREAGAAVTVL